MTNQLKHASPDQTDHGYNKRSSRRNKNRKKKSEITKRRKKKIVVTDKQKKVILSRMRQGFNSERIAGMVGLPKAVIKRYYDSEYFDIRSRISCMNCGDPVKIGQTTCPTCKKRASLIDDCGMYEPTESRPSEISGIEIGPHKKG